MLLACAKRSVEFGDQRRSGFGGRLAEDVGLTNAPFSHLSIFGAIRRRSSDRLCCLLRQVAPGDPRTGLLRGSPDRVTSGIPGPGYFSVRVPVPRLVVGARASTPGGIPGGSPRTGLLQRSSAGAAPGRRRARIYAWVCRECLVRCQAAHDQVHPPGPAATARAGGRSRRAWLRHRQARRR
jgi:hypothetical protein